MTDWRVAQTIMMHFDFEEFRSTMMMALLGGHPPLYVQMTLATMAFILLRLYFLFRVRRENKQKILDWLTAVYGVLLIALSLGTWEFLEVFYKVHGKPVFHAIDRLI